jgi:hypothetical protein
VIENIFIIINRISVSERIFNDRLDLLVSEEIHAFDFTLDP